MNRQKGKSRIIPAMEIMEGGGVNVHRTIGTPALRSLDPFMMLDHMSSDKPEDYLAGFPSHPHRGFNTFTYMIDGVMEHKDSMGNTGKLGPGSAQWMKAGSGVIHSEMPKQKNGLLRGFQLWINLPAANKMDNPEYQEYPATAFPVIEHQDYNVKVLIGHYEEATAPIIDVITEVAYLDVQVKPNGHFRHQLPAGQNGFIYVFEGDGRSHGQAISKHSLATLDHEDGAIEFIAGETGARFVLISGKPINESVVQYGPFVMNTREEIDQAMSDYQSNNFVRQRAWQKN